MEQIMKESVEAVSLQSMDGAEDSQTKSASRTGDNTVLSSLDNASNQGGAKVWETNYDYSKINSLDQYIN